MQERRELVEKLKTMTKEQIEDELKKYKIEYFNLRAKNNAKDKTITYRLSNVQKDIARCLTRYRAIQIEELKKEYENKQYQPTCLRVRTTKARRQALTTKQQNLKVKKVACRNHSYRPVKYALK